MAQDQIMGYQHLQQQNHDFLDKLINKCYLDAPTGKFHCKNCGNAVHVDWLHNTAFCTLHGIII